MHPNKKYFKQLSSIPIDQFFLDVLYNKKYGYYSTKYPFEKQGDYITASTVSPLFAEIIGIWIVYMWEKFKKPKNFNVVELGPGNGKFMNTLIKTFENFPEFNEAVKIFLYEKSLSLKDKQRKNLLGRKVKWISNFDKIRKGPVIFFGNEFFDAIPIKQFVKKEDKIFENYVSHDKNFKVKRELKLTKKKDLKFLKYFKDLKKLNFIEYPKLGFLELDAIVSAIKRLGGGVMLIDYGYIKPQNIDTLQSIKKHRKNPILENLGNADITSLVNFGLLDKYFKKNKLFVEKIVTQSFFLKKTGILERAQLLSQNMNFSEKTDLYLRLKRLLDQKFMGNLFKVIFACKIKRKNLIGFN